MQRRFQDRRRASLTVGRAFPIAVLIAAAVYVLTALVAALIVSTWENPTGGIGICSLISLPISGGIGGFINARMREDGGFGFSLLAALTVALITMSISLIAIGTVRGGGVMNCLTYVGGALAGAFLGSRRTRKRVRRRI